MTGVAIAATVITTMSMSPMIVRRTAAQQANEQFIPSLVYRTGRYAPTGIPFVSTTTSTRLGRAEPHRVSKIPNTGLLETRLP
jgi:hypothetical protein